MQKWLIGIDEAGRGPLAGPVSVGVVCISPEFDWTVLPGVNDSKKLTHKKREEIYTLARILKQERKLAFAVAMVGASSIDRIGIVPCVQKAMRTALRQLQEEVSLIPSRCSVRLDGSLHAPEEFLHQETIIGGDGKEKVIGLASIVAKVTRDRYMEKLAQKKEFSPYNFAIHKGYATKSHCELIRIHGLSSMHRESFCRKLI